MGAHNDVRPHLLGVRPHGSRTPGGNALFDTGIGQA